MPTSRIITRYTPASWLNNRLLKAFGLSFFIVSLLLSFGCKREIDDTGFNVLPASDSIGVFYNDTATVVLRTVLLDSIETDSLSSQLFGNYIDMQMGRISASSFFKVRIPGDSIYFGDPDSTFADSVALYLNLEGVYGRYNSPQKLRIHELSENFPPYTDTLNSRDILTHYPDELSGGFWMDFRKYPGFTNLRVRLTNDIAEKLLHAPTETLADNTLFQQYFKGLTVSTEPVTYLSREPGAIFNLNLTELSAIMLYYRVLRSDGTYKQDSFAFGTGGCRKFTHIDRTEFADRLLGIRLQQLTTDY